MASISELAMVELGEEFQAILGFLNDCLAGGKGIHEIEQGLNERLRQLGLSCIKGAIVSAGPGDCGPAVERNGRELKRSQKPHRRHYHSIFGRIEICRYVYQIRKKKAAEYIPTDESLQLPAEEHSYLLEDWSQRLTTQCSYSEAKTVLKELLGVDISVRALENINRRMASSVNGYWESAAPPTPEEEDEIIVVSADGKGVPMRESQEDRLERQIGKRKVVRPRAVSYERTEKRRCRGKRKSKKQMAYLGVAYTVNRFVRKPRDVLDEIRRKKKRENRPIPQNKRFRAEMNYVVDQELSPGQPRLFDWLEREVQARNPHKQKTVVCLMDGQKSLWYWQREHLPEAVGILDIFHVLEKLWKAAHCFHAESSKPAEKFVEKYLKMMLEGNAGCVVGVLRRFVKNLRGTKKKSLEEVITYFDRNKAFMRYDKYIKHGYPIGSGVIEGGCRHVVRDRMELSGMRWTVEGAQDMLRLRTTKISGEWKQFVEYRVREETRRLYDLAG